MLSECHQKFQEFEKFAEVIKMFQSCWNIKKMFKLSLKFQNVAKVFGMSTKLSEYCRNVNKTLIMSTNVVRMSMKLSECQLSSWNINSV